MFNWLDYYRPRFDCHFAKELWFYDLPDRQYYFHLFSIQIRKKYETALVITVLGLTCYVTSSAFSKFVDGYLTNILKKLDKEKIIRDNQDV
jgi:hypothetical protein